MKKYIFFLVSLCCALLPAMADQPEHPELKASDANIIGHVLDKKTGEHLSYITIALKGTTIGTVTDATGHYFLKNLPEGDFVLEASSVGYKTISRNVTLKKGKTLEENFELEEDAVALDGVVVSANRSVTKRRLAPTLVNVVDMKMFENTNSPTLSQGLNFQPGVRVETNCQNCGFQQVRINGLDGPYTQILIDSRPIFSALSGVYGLEQIPANMIERVEVMRGGGSALFGSSAIAGTINIITKEPLRNSGQLAHTITSIGGSSSFDNNTSLNASLVTDDHRAGLYVFGQNRHRDAYDHDGDGYSEMPKLKNQTVGFRSFLKTSTYSKLTFEYHHLQEFRRGGNMLNRPPHEADIAEQIQHSINGGGLKFDYFAPNEKHRLTLYTSAQHTDRDSYYGSKKDLNAYGKTTDLTFIGGSQYVYSFDKCLFMPADLTAGLEYNRDNLKDDMWGYNRYTRQTVNIGSAFFQNEWKNEKWSILLGGRLDKHNLINHVIFSPRANLRFNPTQDVNRHLSRPLVPIAPEVILHDDADRRMGGGIRVAVPVKDPCHTPGVLIGGKHRGGAYHIVAQFPRFDAVVLVARSVQPRDTDVIFHIVVWKRHVISFVGGRQRRGIRRIRRAEHHSHHYYQTGQHRYDGHAPLPPCRYHHSSFPGTFPRILHCVRVGHDHGRFSFATAGFSTYVVRACRLPASCG